MTRLRPFRKIGNSNYLKLESSDPKDLNIDIENDLVDIDKIEIIKNGK